MTTQTAPARTCSELIARHAEAWKRATTDPFLDGARDGSLPRDAFERWLVQDRYFAYGLFAAQARILALAPPEDWEVVIGGLQAMLEEVRWFDENLTRRGLELEAPVHETCQGYIDYMLTLAFAPYAVAITALWACERAYLEAWSSALPGAEPFQEFVEHWTVPGFRAYVEGLERAADRALKAASDRDREAAEEAFLRVARFERAFWSMTAEGRVG